MFEDFVNSRLPLVEPFSFEEALVTLTVRGETGRDYSTRTVEEGDKTPSTVGYCGCSTCLKSSLLPVSARALKTDSDTLCSVEVGFCSFVSILTREEGGI